jgi:hypothetical protein
MNQRIRDTRVEIDLLFVLSHREISQNKKYTGPVCHK